MKENFDKTLDFVMASEGNKVHNVAGDSGGLTSAYGITLATMQTLKLDLNKDGAVDDKDVAMVNSDVVRDVFRKHYWDAINADELEAGFDLILADFAYNAGVGRAKQYMNYETVEELTAARIKFYEGLAAKKPVLNKFLKGWRNRANRALAAALKC